MTMKSAPIAGIVILLISLFCPSPAVCGGEYSALDVTGVWLLSFEPPILRTADLGGPAQQKYEFRCKVILKQVPDRILGVIYWDEGDMSSALQVWPTLTNDQLRLPVPCDLELIGRLSGKDTFVGQVLLQPGKALPIPGGSFKDTYQRRFQLSRISTKVPPKGQHP